MIKKLTILIAACWCFLSAMPAIVLMECDATADSALCKLKAETLLSKRLREVKGDSWYFENVISKESPSFSLIFMGSESEGILSYVIQTQTTDSEDFIGAIMGAVSKMSSEGDALYFSNPYLSQETIDKYRRNMQELPSGSADDHESIYTLISDKRFYNDLHDLILNKVWAKEFSNREYIYTGNLFIGYAELSLDPKTIFDEYKWTKDKKADALFIQTIDALEGSPEESDVEVLFDIFDIINGDITFEKNQSPYRVYEYNDVYNRKGEVKVYTPTIICD